MLHPAVNWLHQSNPVVKHEHYTLSGRAPVVTGVFVFFAVLTTITTALRIYVRRSMTKKFGLDDWTSALGWLLFVAYCALIITGCHHGLGQFTDRISPGDLPTTLKFWWIAELLNILCFAMVKTSITIQLLCYVVESYQKYLVLGVNVLLLVYSATLFFLYIFQCMPPSFYWTRIEGTMAGACLNYEIINDTDYAYASLTVLVDLTMAIIPWLMVRKLQLTLKTRVMVSIILGFGSIALIATIVRIPYLPSLTDPGAFLYNAGDVWIWSCAEVGLSLSASSVITLKPLVKKLISTSQKSTMVSDEFKGQEIQLKKLTPLGNTTQMTGPTLVNNFADDIQFLEHKAKDDFDSQDFPRIVRRGTALRDL